METTDARISGLKNSKIDTSYGGDRITNLPEPVIHHIFSFLETIDLIRASAVSRRWRYLWTSIPYFSFDIHTLRSDPHSFGSVRDINERFKHFVDWVLLSRDGSVGICKFRLSCLMYEDDYAVYRWISLAARRGLQELDLIVNSETPIRLPFSLVSCESLVALKLHLNKCVLQFPSFRGFSRLKSLELGKVELTDEAVARNFIKACPFLEDLSMWGCIFQEFKVLEISATNLKKLNIDNHAIGDASDDGLYSTKLKLACPNLVSLDFMGPLALDFSLQELSSLENVFIFLDDSDKKYATVKEQAYLRCKILKGICTANVLKLSMHFLEFLYLAPAVVDSSFISLGNLRSLKLAMGMRKCYMKSLITLLEWSPNLEFLRSEWNAPDKPISCLTYCIKRVELIDVEDNQNVMGFIKFVLKNGHTLERMNITWWIDAENNNTGESAQKILEFQRSSPSIILRFFESMSDINFFEL